MLARDDDILKAEEDWRRQGRGVALATVVETWGSAPRPVGSNLVIDQEGNFLGSVSGGCVEGAVVTEAIDVIESGKPKMLEFGVADETAWKVGLSCGGTIRVFVEKVDRVVSGEWRHSLHYSLFTTHYSPRLGSCREARGPESPQHRARRAARRDRRHRRGDRHRAAGQGDGRRARPAERCAQGAAAHRQERHGGDAGGPRLPHGARAAAAPRHHRRRA